MKSKKRLIYHLWPSYLVITLLALVAVSGYMLSFTRQFYLERTQTDLEIHARMLEKQILRRIVPLDQNAVDRLCKEAAGQTVTRLTVILPDGRVVGDSEEMPTQMENHRDREEFRQALAGVIGVGLRHSDTLKVNMMYVALPLIVDQKVIGVLRTSLPVTAIDERLAVVRWRIAGGALLVALLATGISWVVSRQIAVPIERMRDGSRRYAQGELTHRLALPDTRELSALADSMNRMAEQLQQRMDEITNQRKEMEAVLASMHEGVVATDLHQRVIRINRAAAAMFATSMDAVQGQNVVEMIRNHEFKALMERSLADGENRKADIVHHLSGSECILSVRGTALMDAGQQRIGTLVVFNDVTQLRRLETMRRDFAASVSHEIKTPLTAIKGFVETLSTGDLKDREETRRFLQIVDRHVHRLTTIINDLMQLSRIEQADESRQIGEKVESIADVLQAAIAFCATCINEKGIEIELDCPMDLCARIDVTLLEQAVANLLDNAVKCSPETGTVWLAAAVVGEEIQIRLTDQGPGIPEKHLPRLFERFYRVDPARSRQEGGTGLGLAIVKHIAQAHGGRVSVESQPGQGSTFTIHLPA